MSILTKKKYLSLAKKAIKYKDFNRARKACIKFYEYILGKYGNEYWGIFNKDECCWVLKDSCSYCVFCMMKNAFFPNLGISCLDYCPVRKICSSKEDLTYEDIIRKLSEKNIEKMCKEANKLIKEITILKRRKNVKKNAY